MIDIARDRQRGGRDHRPPAAIGSRRRKNRQRTRRRRRAGAAPACRSSASPRPAAARPICWQARRRWRTARRAWPRRRGSSRNSFSGPGIGRSRCRTSTSPSDDRRRSSGSSPARAPTVRRTAGDIRPSRDPVMRITIRLPKDDQIDRQHQHHRPDRLGAQQQRQHRHAEKAGIADHRALRLDRGRLRRSAPRRKRRPSRCHRPAPCPRDRPATRRAVEDLGQRRDWPRTGTASPRARSRRRTWSATPSPPR